MKSTSISLVLIMVLILLCSCGKKGGYDTAEDAALAFVQAVVENDPELFKTCVYPSMLEEWMSSFHIDGDTQAKIKEISVITSYEIFPSEDDIQDLQEEFGITVERGKVVKVHTIIYDYRREEERIMSFETGAVYIDGRWYATGWS